MDNILDYEINKELGECYLFMGDYDKAEEFYTKAANDNPESNAPVMGLATVAVQRGDLDTALTQYHKAAAIEETGKALCGIGLVHMEKGNSSEACKFFTKALEKDPGNIVALNCLVREAYKNGNLETIVPFLSAAVDNTEDREAVLVTLAGCLIYLGRNDEAREHLESVLGSNPANEGAKEMIAAMAA